MSKKKNFDILDDIIDPQDVCVTLELDNNETLECRPVSIFEANGQDYIALLPIDEDGMTTQTDVFLYRYFEDEEGNPSLENILDDDEFEIACDRFDELQDEEEFENM